MFRNSKGSSGNTVLYCGAVMAMVSKRSESFDNNVFFDIEAKRTRSIEIKVISKRSKHVYITKRNIKAKRRKLILNCESSEANMLNGEKFIAKRSEPFFIKEFKYRRKGS
jgi:hypothetical protein